MQIDAGSQTRTGTPFPERDFKSLNPSSQANDLAPAPSGDQPAPSTDVHPYKEDQSPNQAPVAPAAVQTYFVHAPVCGRVKIGKSIRVKSRFAALSCASPEWLVLLGVLDGDLELEMHERFGKYRVKGEWFELIGKLQHFVWAEFVDELRSLEFTRYTPDPAFVGGVPGRITLDYEFGAILQGHNPTLVEQLRRSYAEVSR